MGTFRLTKINKSKLLIGGEMGLTLTMPVEQPNWFWRMMQRLVFGFEWKKL